MKNYNEIDLREYKVLDWGYTANNFPTEESIAFYKKAIFKGKLAGLDYMTTIEAQRIRSDLKTFYFEFESALVFLFEIDDFLSNRVASYLTSFNGKDYHFELAARLEQIAAEFSLEHGEFKTIVDTSPVLEKDLAYRSGLGVFGKNTLLLNKNFGSKFLIGSLLLSKKLPLLGRKDLEEDLCANCNKCVLSCPTNALDGKRSLDVRKCIANYTVEQKFAAAPVGFDKQSFIFGCDICLRACPYNTKSSNGVSALESFISSFLERPNLEIISDLDAMSNREFRRKFKGTALERFGKNGLLKNLKCSK